MNAKDEETYVRQVILPEFLNLFSRFTKLIAIRDFAKLAELFPIGCTAEEFQAATEINEVDGPFIEPPSEAYKDIYYDGTLSSFQIGDAKCSIGFHSINLYSDGADNKEFSGDMYMWDSQGKTDVSLLLRFNNKVMNQPKLTSVDLRIV